MKDYLITYHFYNLIEFGKERFSHQTDDLEGVISYFKNEVTNTPDMYKIEIHDKETRKSTFVDLYKVTLINIDEEKIIFFEGFYSETALKDIETIQAEWLENPNIEDVTIEKYEKGFF